MTFVGDEAMLTAYQENGRSVQVQIDHAMLVKINLQPSGSVTGRHHLQFSLPKTLRPHSTPPIVHTKVIKDKNREQKASDLVYTIEDRDVYINPKIFNVFEDDTKSAFRDLFFTLVPQAINEALTREGTSVVKTFGKSMGGLLLKQWLRVP